MFHFTKDKSTFSRFALEMMAVDSNIRHLKKVGTNMDESIYNGVKAVIPEVKQLYCDRHLRQRDEKNLMRYLVQQNEVHRKEIAPRTKSRKGLYKKFGLAEPPGKPDFNIKLALLREKWESRCSGFYDWFLKHRKEKFENSVIALARDGSNVFGMFY